MNVFDSGHQLFEVHPDHIFREATESHKCKELTTTSHLVNSIYAWLSGGTFFPLSFCVGIDHFDDVFMLQTHLILSLCHKRLQVLEDFESKNLICIVIYKVYCALST